MQDDRAVLRREIARMDYEASIHAAHERRRFQQEIGLTACKTIVLVNGGAIIALLTFVGNSPGTLFAAGLRDAFMFFSVGIVSPLVSLWLGYFGQEWMGNSEIATAWDHQLHMAGEKRQLADPKVAKVGWRLILLASALVILGVAAFVFGAFAALNAIL